LAIWGLTADDIRDFPMECSCRWQEKHGTRIWNNILTAISRSQATLCLLWHSKGGFASWQMMGLLQLVNTGITSGNRNSQYVLSFPHIHPMVNHYRSTIDAHFRAHRLLMFLFQVDPHVRVPR
jgi:3-oxoacyl-(acyl-carrier-protein) synthase